MAVIDSLEFARTGQTLSGSLPLAGLTRLKDSLYDAAGEVRFSVKGGHDTRRRPVLKLEISGTLCLQCQRCMGVLEYPLRVANTLLLVAGEAGGFTDEDLEWIAASATQDVPTLVEDEILLSLPYAPRHEEAQCGGASEGAVSERDGTIAFARLAALKRNSQ